MISLRQMRSSWQDKKLTMTFRCPKTIVARQQAHAPGFRAWQGVAEGSFRQLGGPHYKGDSENGIGDWSWAQFRQLAEGPAVMLCRNNAPLLAMAFKLIRQQVAPVMAGRDIGKGLTALASKIAGAKDKSKVESISIEIFLAKLDDWELTERSLALSKDEGGARLDSIADRAESLRAVADGCGARSSDDLLRGLELLFAKESGDVVLSSIHRAKGLEWDLVLHLDPWRIPSKRAKAAARDGDDSQLEQEWNLKYVCETRTRHTLVQANLEDFHG